MSFPEGLPREFDDLARASAGLSSLLEFASDANSRIPESVTVQDDTESIELTMLRDGTVVDFQLESDWKDEIEPEELGNTLSSLIGEAQQALYEDADAYLLERREEFEAEEESRDPDLGVEEMHNDAGKLLRKAQARGPVVMKEVMDRALDYVYSGLEEFGEGGTDDSSDVETIPLDEVDDVACESAGGTITKVIINAAWARTTPTAAVRQRIEEVLTEAQEGDENSGAAGEEFNDILLDVLQLMATPMSSRK